MLLGAPAAGNLTDWLGRRPVVIWSVFLFPLGSGLCGAAVISLVPLTARRGKRGAGAGGTEAAATSAA